jgi:hypothetical protein
MIIDPGWAAHEDGDAVVVHAGADLVYEVSDLDAPQRARLVTWFAGSPITDGDLGDRHTDVVSLLLSLGAIHVERKSATVEVMWIGDVDAELQHSFVRTLREFDVVVESSETAFLLVVKTNVGMYDCALQTDELVSVGRTHLLCDLGFDHTVTIGPTVVPGQTACVRCVAERIGGRWTDTIPPRKPHAVRDGAMAVATLLGRVLRKTQPAEDGTPGVFPFLNEVITLDLDRVVTTCDRVFRSPWCSACSLLR